MKIGIRTPNLKSSLKAKTVGKVKRDVKRAVNPLYGKSGMGIINDPKKALYNKVYKKTTVGINLNLRTTSGKEIHEYEHISDFLSEVDIDTISMEDIDEMTVEALEIIYSSNQSKKLSKENRKKLDRIASKIILCEIIPQNLCLPEHVKTKSGKSRHDFTSDYRYLADLDLSTIREYDIDNMDFDTLKAIYDAKTTSWKRKDEKPIFKKIEQRYFKEII